MQVLCDYLALTFPGDGAPALRSELIGFLATQGVESDNRSETYRALDGGTARIRNYGPVLSVGLSGALLASLRASGAMRELLALLSAVPHRVTRLDACLDLHEDAPPHLDVAFRLAIGGRVRLGQRVVPPQSVGRVTRPALHGGPLTGSVYIGERGADRRLLVYDKRNERLDRGHDDPGPLTRYEVSVGKGGRARVTLRDAEDPTALFWSVAGAVLPVPPGVPVWKPAGEGYALPSVPRSDPLQRLTRALDRSEALANLAAMAVAADPSSPGAAFDPDSSAWVIYAGACKGHYLRALRVRIAQASEKVAA